MKYVLWIFWHFSKDMDVILTSLHFSKWIKQNDFVRKIEKNSSVKAREVVNGLESNFKNYSMYCNNYTSLQRKAFLNNKKRKVIALTEFKLDAFWARNRILQFSLTKNLTFRATKKSENFRKMRRLVFFCRSVLFTMWFFKLYKIFWKLIFPHFLVSAGIASIWFDDATPQVFFFFISYFNHSCGNNIKHKHIVICMKKKSVND